VNAQLYTSSLAYFDDFFLDILLRLRNDLLYSGWMNPAILDEPMQRQTRNLPSYGIKTRNNNRLRGVIYDDLHASGRFQRTDIPTFPTDHLALDIVAFNVENRHTVFDGMFCGGSLDRI